MWPRIFWSPAKIKPAVIADRGCNMDLFTTFGRLAGMAMPNDRIIDGLDIGGTLLDGKPCPHKSMLYCPGANIYAARLGDYKAHYITEGEYGMFGKKEMHDPPLLCNVDVDPSEKFNIADKHPRYHPPD